MAEYQHYAGYLHYENEDGSVADADLHDEIMRDADTDAAKAVTRGRLLARGWSKAEVDALLDEQ